MILIGEAGMVRRFDLRVRWSPAGLASLARALAQSDPTAGALLSDQGEPNVLVQLLFAGAAPLLADPTSDLLPTPGDSAFQLLPLDLSFQIQGSELLCHRAWAAPGLIDSRWRADKILASSRFQAATVAPLGLEAMLNLLASIPLLDAAQTLVSDAWITSPQGALMSVGSDEFIPSALVLDIALGMDGVHEVTGGLKANTIGKIDQVGAGSVQLGAAATWRSFCRSVWTSQLAVDLFHQGGTPSAKAEASDAESWVTAPPSGVPASDWEDATVALRALASRAAGLPAAYGVVSLLESFAARNAGGMLRAVGLTRHAAFDAFQGIGPSFKGMSVDELGVADLGISDDEALTLLKVFPTGNSRLTTAAGDAGWWGFSYVFDGGTSVAQTLSGAQSLDPQTSTLGAYVAQLQSWLANPKALATLAPGVNAQAAQAILGAASAIAESERQAEVEAELEEFFARLSQDNVQLDPIMGGPAVGAEAMAEGLVVDIGRFYLAAIIEQTMIWEFPRNMAEVPAAGAPEEKTGGDKDCVCEPVAAESGLQRVHATLKKLADSPLEWLAVHVTFAASEWFAKLDIPVPVKELVAIALFVGVAWALVGAVALSLKVSILVILVAAAVRNTLGQLRDAFASEAALRKAVQDGAYALTVQNLDTDGAQLDIRLVLQPTGDEQSGEGLMEVSLRAELRPASGPLDADPPPEFATVVFTDVRVRPSAPFPLDLYSYSVLAFVEEDLKEEANKLADRLNEQIAASLQAVARVSPALDPVVARFRAIDGNALSIELALAPAKWPKAAPVGSVIVGVNASADSDFAHEPVPGVVSVTSQAVAGGVHVTTRRLEALASIRAEVHGPAVGGIPSSWTGAASEIAQPPWRGAASGRATMPLQVAMAAAPAWPGFPPDGEVAWTKELLPGSGGSPPVATLRAEQESSALIKALSSWKKLSDSELAQYLDEAEAEPLLLWFSTTADVSAYGDLLALVRRAQAELLDPSVAAKWGEFGPWLDLLGERLTAAYTLPSSATWPGPMHKLLLPIQSAKSTGWQERYARVATKTVFVGDPTAVDDNEVVGGGVSGDAGS